MSQAVAAFVEQRIREVLWPWYDGCDDVDETRRNAERDLGCIHAEVRRRFGTELRGHFRIRSDGNGQWTVGLIAEDAN